MFQSEFKLFADWIHFIGNSFQLVALTACLLPLLTYLLTGLISCQNWMTVPREEQNRNLVIILL